MKRTDSKIMKALLKLVYNIGRSTVLAISRLSAYQPKEDGEVFRMVYKKDGI